MKYVHIAGTNGKGSTAEYISGIITAAGIRCGCFTSPHIVSPAERLRIDGQSIEEHVFNELIAEAKEKKLTVNDTLFAAQTAAALLWFERGGAEYAVLETGLGGRLDPTNYVEPCISVLTPVDFDHTNVLGKTLRDIAREKSGIIKPGVPVICAEQHMEVMNIIKKRCENAGAPLTVTPPARVLSASVHGQIFEIGKDRYKIKAMGEHQAGNAALAACAARTLGMGGGAVKKGLEEARLRCRAQLFAGDPDILIDGAHNPAAVDALIKVLDAHFDGRDKILLFACMADKDYAAMAGKLAWRFSKVYVTRADAKRGADTEILRGLFSKHTVCEAVQDPLDAFCAAKESAAGGGALLAAAGSFYLAGIIEPLLTRR
ncbi:MAG: cyanophycin synthetase [Christensenellales bacterium]